MLSPGGIGNNQAVIGAEKGAFLRPRLDTNPGSCATGSELLAVETGNRTMRRSTVTSIIGIGKLNGVPG